MHILSFIRIRSFISHISFILFVIDYQCVFLPESLVEKNRPDGETASADRKPAMELCTACYVNSPMVLKKAGGASASSVYPALSIVVKQSGITCMCDYMRHFVKLT